MALSEFTYHNRAKYVIEIGNEFTKCGVSGCLYPFFLLRTQFVGAKSLTYQLKDLFHLSDENLAYEALILFFDEIFYKLLLGDPKSKNIVIIEDLFWPVKSRNLIAKLLFTQYGVTSLLFIPTALSAYTTLAVDTAIVVDIGYESSTITPVAHGSLLLDCACEFPFALKAIESQLISKLKARYPGHQLNHKKEDVQSLIRNCCFVSSVKRMQKLKQNQEDKLCPDVDCSTVFGQKIVLLGLERETICEVLFQPNLDGISLQSSILLSISNSPIDYRKELMQNIFIIGGTSSLPGLKSRLKEELKMCVLDQFSDFFPIKNLHFHSVDIKSNCVSWVGGSILSNLDIFVSRGVSKENFASTEHVPDWSDIC